MDLEFQESDIVFSSDQSSREFDAMPGAVSVSSPKGRGKSKESSSKSNKRKVATQTVPVDIPSNFFHQKRDPGNRNVTGRVEFHDYDDDYEGDEEMVPPHVIEGRRIARKIAFSVCTGIGRTLKGRDLSEVRNSILRLTGFLES